jgi:hypothetical protein
MTPLNEKIYILTVQCIYIFTDGKMTVYVRSGLEKVRFICNDISPNSLYPSFYGKKDE